MSKAEERRSRKLHWIIRRVVDTTDVTASEAPRKADRYTFCDFREFSGATFLFNENDPDVDIYFNDAISWDMLPHKFDVRSCIAGATGDFPIIFQRLQRVPIKELRGMPVRSEKVVRLYCMGIAGKKRFSTVKTFEYLPGANWAYVDTDSGSRGWRKIGGFWSQEDSRKPYQEELNHLNWGLTHAFSDQYQWKVEFTGKGGFRIAVALHPHNISKMFKLREKYTDRRKALRHLVTHHWRLLASDFDVETFVRVHLRGQMSFDWFGLQCKVVVPIGLKQDIDIARRDRELMRIRGTDRRVGLASAVRSR